MERRTYEKFNRFFKESGYKNQRELVKKLVEDEFYEELASGNSMFNQIVNGKRPINQKLLGKLEELSIDTKKFTELVENSKEEYIIRKNKIYPHEKEADNLYEEFRATMLGTNDIYEKMHLLQNFKKFVKKHSKKI